MSVRVEPEQFIDLMKDVGVDLKKLLYTPVNGITEDLINETIEKNYEFFYVFIDYGEDFEIHFMSSNDEGMQKYSDHLNEGYNFDEGPTLCYTAFEDLVELLGH